MSRLAIAIVGFATLIGCSLPTDLDNPCRLSVPDPNNDGGVVFISTNDPIVTATDSTGALTFPQFDFLSSGDPDCEDLICIRMANPATGFYDDSDGIVHGRCSNNCIIDQGTNKSSDCGEAEKGLVCQQLSLDQTFINSYCSSDPADCSSIFGSDDPSATYCVDPLASASSSGS